MKLTISGLNVYPVKSLRGIALQEAELTPFGVTHDRAWLLIDGQGRFLSQRRLPAMALVATRLTENHLVLSREGMTDLVVPVSPPAGGRRLQTEVWDDHCEVIDQGDDAARWFAEALGIDQDVRLVRMAEDFRRGLKRPERYGRDTTTFFADTAPFLVAGTASLDALNRELESLGEAPVPMNRFRANIVLNGLDAFAEHRITDLSADPVRLGLRYPRERCVMTTMDQETGEKHPGGEPFATLRRLNPMPDNPLGPAFGELAVLEAGDGASLRIGQELKARLREKD